MEDNAILKMMRYEYQRAARLSLARLGCSLLVVLPPITSLLDTTNKFVYPLAALSFLALVVWLLVDWIYLGARDRSLAARRALMVSNGSGEPIHPVIRTDLLEISQPSEDATLLVDVHSYYASTAPPGPKRILEIVEESAFYSERTQKHSGFTLGFVVVTYIAIFLLGIIVAVPSLSTALLEVLMQFFMICAAFVLSGDLFQRAFQHLKASSECRRIQKACLALSKQDASTTDALLLLSDYFGAMQGAPETLPHSFSQKQHANIERSWKKRKTS